MLVKEVIELAVRNAGIYSLETENADRIMRMLTESVPLQFETEMSMSPWKFFSKKKRTYFAHADN